MIVQKLLGLDRNTWNHITVQKKLLLLKRNSYLSIKIFLQIIMIINWMEKRRTSPLNNLSDRRTIS